MTLNMGKADRGLRLVAAVALVLIALFVTEGALSWVLGLVAVVFVATAAVGTCPAYLPFGISTCKTPSSP